MKFEFFLVSHFQTLRMRRSKAMPSQVNLSLESSLISCIELTRSVFELNVKALTLKLGITGADGLSDLN